METNKNGYDVIVVGGGPAGSTIASILAREGRSVVLFEKEEFPRHHIGESLMTDTYWTFQRMGFLEKLKESPFVRKYSVQFANPAGKESRPFYFFEALHHESAVTWQVTRAVFDKMLIEHAGDQGAAIHQGVPVKQVIFNGDQAVGVEVQMKDGSRQSFYAKVVVDATGQSAMLSNKFRWRVRDPKLKKAVLYSYFKGAQREPDLNGEPARVGQIGRRDALRLIGEAEFNELHAIGLGVEAEAARRRQAGPAQRREIRRLGAEPLGVHGLRVVEGNQKVHTALR